MSMDLVVNILIPFLKGRMRDSRYRKIYTIISIGSCGAVSDEVLWRSSNSVLWKVVQY